MSDSPVPALREYAAAAEKGDKTLMKSYLSSNSIAYFAQRQTTSYTRIDHLGSRLLVTRRSDDRREYPSPPTEIDCMLPKQISFFGGISVSGKGFTVNMVKENGIWKVDAAHLWQELDKRFSEMDQR